MVRYSLGKVNIPRKISEQTTSVTLAVSNQNNVKIYLLMWPYLLQPVTRSWVQSLNTKSVYMKNKTALLTFASGNTASTVTHNSHGANLHLV